MYYKLNENEYKLLNEIECITNSDYEVGDIIDAQNIMSALEDLKIAYDELLEEYNDWQEKACDRGFNVRDYHEYMSDYEYEKMRLGER